jgi:hypothetical protein
LGFVHFTVLADAEPFQQLIHVNIWWSREVPA